MKSTTTIDATRFLADVDKIRIQRNLTWNGVFHQTWITNLSQVRRGLRGLTLNCAQTLAEWAELDLAAYERKAVSA